jgi:hypothetical protein
MTPCNQHTRGVAGVNTCDFGYNNRGQDGQRVLKGCWWLRPTWQRYLMQPSALAGFETLVGLVDDVDPAFAADNAVVAVTLAQRL